MEKDMLAVSTLCLLKFIQFISSGISYIQETKFYRVLTGTTQPAHLMAIIAALVTVASYYPESQLTPGKEATYKFLYLTSTATHFGTEIWMTFASGLSLYFNLPRHHFGDVQVVLFPLYFFLTSTLSCVALFSRQQLVPVDVFTYLLTLRFAMELCIRLYLCKPLTTLIKTKNEIERDAGLGDEVGKIDLKVLAHNCEYVSAYTDFRRQHMVVAMMNIVCIAVSAAHIFRLAQSLQFGTEPC